MKRISILTAAAATFLMTSLSSCDKDHFYEAKITVVTLDGTVVPGATVEPTNIIVDRPHDLDPDRYRLTTGEDGTVLYKFDNELQIPIKASIISFNGQGPYEGIGEIKVEEDETVKRTITVYVTE